MSQRKEMKIMLNAKEVQELVKQYEDKMVMKQLERVSDYLDAVGAKIHNASLSGFRSITVEDMENLEDSRIAVKNMKSLGYEVNRDIMSDSLTIHW